MGRCSWDEEWEFSSPSTGVRNIVLVGRTGNGKSATGNTILGKKEFISKRCSVGVASTCQVKPTYMSDGQILNVIDTPGLFDIPPETELISKDIVECINMAEDGIHAFLLVFSVMTRFSREEEAAFRSLQALFGEKIIDYMIVVFTGGDELEDNDETLEDYLGRDCPEPLKEILRMCGNRRMVFDNKTKDETKKAEQREQLLSLVNTVIAQNGDQPYTYELFPKLKIQMKLKETTSKLQLEERAARLNAGKISQIAQRESDIEISRLRELVNMEKRKTMELRKQAETLSCIIL